MNESAFIGGFLGAFAFNALYVFIDRFVCCDEEEEEEAFWESHQFEDSLEKADELCEVGYTFQRNEMIYKKISEKKWLAELLPYDDKFEIGYELEIDDYLYKKLVKSVGRLKKYDLSIIWPVLRL